MLAQEDLNILKKYGFGSPEDAARTLVTSLKNSGPVVIGTPSGLGVTETEILDDIGATASVSAIQNGALGLAIKMRALEAASLNTDDAAKLLNVTPIRIRQRIKEKTIYVLNSNESGRLFPAFQFHQGETLPGLKQILKNLREAAHPLAVLAFFTSPHCDLESDQTDDILTPAEWLITGHSSQLIAELIEEL